MAVLIFIEKYIIPTNKTNRPIKRRGGYMSKDKEEMDKKDIIIANTLVILIVVGALVAGVVFNMMS